MALDPVYEGEDVPIQATYVDSAGAAVAPDGVSGGTGPTVTVTGPDGTDAVAAVVMTENEVGTYEHVWDTTGVGTGTYVVAVSAELSAETDIEKETIEVR